MSLVGLAHPLLWRGCETVDVLVYPSVPVLEVRERRAVSTDFEELLAQELLELNQLVRLELD